MSGGSRLFMIGVWSKTNYGGTAHVVTRLQKNSWNAYEWQSHQRCCGFPAHRLGSKVVRLAEIGMCGLEGGAAGVTGMGSLLR